MSALRIWVASNLAVFASIAAAGYWEIALVLACLSALISAPIAIRQRRRQPDPVPRGLAISPRLVKHTIAQDLGAARESSDALTRLSGPPTYIARDQDADLQRAVRNALVASPAAVVARGAPNTGKTRSLHAALLAEVPNALIIVPRNSAALVALLTPADRDQPESGRSPIATLVSGTQSAVLFLENLETFLIGDSAALLVEFLDRGVAEVECPLFIAATLGGKGGVVPYWLRSDEEVVDLPSTFLTHPAVLGVEMPAEASADETKRVVAAFGQNVAREVSACGGIARFFVQPHLLEEQFEYISTHCPSARDLVSAAVAWHLAGTKTPITERSLQILWRETFCGGDYVPSQAEFRQAVDVSLKRIRDTAQLLTWTEDGYWADDYLVAMERAVRTPLPDIEWDAIVSLCNAEELLAVGLRERTLQDGPRGEEIRRILAKEGTEGVHAGSAVGTDNEWSLGTGATRALVVFERSAAMGNAEAACAAVPLLVACGRSRDAERLLAAFVPASERASLALAQLYRRRGQFGQALDALSTAAQSPQIALAIAKTFRRRDRPGDLDLAIEAMWPYRAEPSVAQALLTSLRRRSASGDAERMNHVSQSVEDLAPESRALLLEQQGKVDLALDLLEPIDTSTAAAAAAAIRRRRGSPDDIHNALERLQRHIDNPICATMLADMLTQQGTESNLERAKLLLRAHPGHNPAQIRLASILLRSSEVEDKREVTRIVEQLSRSVRDGVDALSLSTILQHRGEAGDLDRAVDVLRPWAIYHMCATRLATILFSQGRVAEAVHVIAPHLERPRVATYFDTTAGRLSSSEVDEVVESCKEELDLPHIATAVGSCLIRRRADGDLARAAQLLRPHEDEWLPARLALLQVSLSSDDLEEVLRSSEELLATNEDIRTDALLTLALERVTAAIGRLPAGRRKQILSGEKRYVIQGLIDRLKGAAVSSFRAAVVVEQALRLFGTRERLDERVALLAPHAGKNDRAAVGLAHALMLRRHAGDLDKAVAVASEFANSNPYCAGALAKALEARNRPGDLEQALKALDGHESSYVGELRARISLRLRGDMDPRSGAA